MTAFVFALALMVAWPLGLVALCRRPGRRPAVAATDQAPRESAGPEVDALDDVGFCSWLGVPPATYERYVDTGVEDLEIYLADRPAHSVGEDPAEPTT